LGGSFLKISFLKVTGFSRMVTAGLRPVFIGINIFQKDRFKKKKLTDIGFIGFSWIKGMIFFNGFGLAINVC
jgi:hypothetical protein